MANRGDQFLPLTSVAARLAVSVKTLRRWGKTGQLPMRKMGGRWKVAQSDLDAMITEATHQPPHTLPLAVLPGQLELV